MTQENEVQQVNTPDSNLKSQDGNDASSINDSVTDGQNESGQKKTVPLGSFFRSEKSKQGVERQIGSF